MDCAKQDLWWPKRDLVRKHYREGSYGKMVTKIGIGKPRKDFSTSLKEVCLCNVNLKTIDGVELAPTCAGYDTAIREFYLTHLLDELKQLVG